jgi:DNA polymerase-3 subunit gamma/tau
MSALFPTPDAPDDATLNMFGDAPVAASAPATAAYRVLARKYRPTNFGELIGQDVVVRTLTNAIKAGRLAQAWMLTGVRGVGKTTTARIIARALNCLGADGQGGATADPCGVCANCIAIAADRHVDVMEMDAASRTGIDDIREIIDGVRYNPVNARYKIYIIDEVHMLSKNAFNALLKTLEEPPPHVKFIFATTEIRKVPVTVLSRCQRFDLRGVDVPTLSQHFANVAAKENSAVEAEALALIARAADGSVRDGLSLLDQAIARGDGNVTTAEVQEMLGLADRGRSMDLARQVLLGAMREALGVYDDLLQVGADPLVILQDMAELIHLLTRAKLAPEAMQGGALSELESKFTADLAPIEIPALTRAWQIILRGIGETQTASNPAQAAEMVLIRIAYAAALPPPADLVRKIQQEQAQAASIPNGGGSGGSGGTMLQMRGNLALAVANPLPLAAIAEPMTITAPVAVAKAILPMPEDFRALVMLCAAQREAKLYSELYQYAHPVKLEPGKLEIFLEPQASADVASRVGKALTDWTGQRWIVTLARASDAPTLASIDQARTKAEHDAVLNHPLVQRALGLFPGAKLVNIRPPTPIALATPTTDDDTTEATEE